MLYAQLGWTLMPLQGAASLVRQIMVFVEEFERSEFELWYPRTVPPYICTVLIEAIQADDVCKTF